jgi:PPM family protein phosphatase
MPEPIEKKAPDVGLPQPPDPPAHSVHADIDALSHRGHVREGNEDAFVVFRIGRYAAPVVSNIPESELPPPFEEKGHVMIVADGVGGMSAGEVASRMAVLTTLERLLHSPQWTLKLDDPETREADLERVRVQAREYLTAVQLAVHERARADPSLEGMGTTFTGAYSVGVDLFVMHVGDSKAFLYRDGVLARITRDHTVAQQFADMGVIAQEDVPTHRMHHVLTRAVGGPDDHVEGDFHHVRLAHGDRLLLCSDGLTEMASEEEIAATLAAHPGSDEACRVLVELALTHGGRDNVTVIVAAYTVG